MTGAHEFDYANLSMADWVRAVTLINLPPNESIPVLVELIEKCGVDTGDIPVGQTMMVLQQFSDGLIKYMADYGNLSRWVDFLEDTDQ